MSTAIFKNINLVDTLPELRLTTTGDSQYVRLYRTTNNSVSLLNTVNRPLTNYALTFNGSSQYGYVDYLTLNNQSFSVSIWAYITTGTTSQFFTQGNTTDDLWAFRLIFDGVDNFMGYGQNHFSFSTTSFTGTVSNCGSANAYTTGWHHIVGTFTAGEYPRLYVDGVLAATGNVAVTNLRWSSSNKLLLGIKSTSYQPITADSISVFTKVLSLSDVQTIYSSGTGLDINTAVSPFNSSLFAGWKITEGTGTTTADISGNNRTMTLVGTPTWVTGFPFASDIVESNILKIDNGFNSLEGGIITLGNSTYTPRVVLDGLTTRFNVGGVEKGQLGSTMAWTLPNTITGSSDAVQFKILGNSTQTSNIMDVFASDGTTPRFHITGAGLVGIGVVPVALFQVSNYGFAPSTFYTGGVVSGMALKNQTTNGRSMLGIIPNGTNTNADIWLFDSPDTTVNYSAMAWGLEGNRTTGHWGWNTLKAGTGTAHAFYFNATNGQNAATSNLFLTTAGTAGIGTGATVSAKLHVLATTEQLRLGYDASNYKSETVGSTGSVTTALTGTSPVNIFSQAIRGNGGFQSSDGSAGATGSFTTVDLKTVTVKNGLITTIV